MALALMLKEGQDGSSSANNSQSYNLNTPQYAGSQEDDVCDTQKPSLSMTSILRAFYSQNQDDTSNWKGS